MSKYHPLDVRYKGPSTAYRGSASRKRQANLPHRLETTGRASPWGARQNTAPPTPQPSRPAHPRPWTILTRSFAVVRRVVRIGIYVQIALAVLVYLLLMGQIPSIDLSGQITSIIGD